MINITFPDGSVRSYEQGITGFQIAESISPALARSVLACGVNGETVELNRPINEDATIELYKWDDCRNCTRASSLVSDLLSRMVSSTMCCCPTARALRRATSQRLKLR